MNDIVDVNSHVSDNHSHVSDNHGDAASNPFDPAIAPGIQLVVLLRLYDVSMAILSSMDKAAAEKLNNIHSQGKIIGSLPYIDM